MAIEHPIPVEILRQLLRLDAETGKLYWLPRGDGWFQDGFHTADHTLRKHNARWAGREALIKYDRDGYRRGCLLGRYYQAHRVVFALHYGRWPALPVDHINGVADANRPDNLREATHSQNNRNIGNKGKTSSFCGVSWDKGTQKWRVYCTDTDGHNTYIGLFTDESEAARAYDGFAQRAHGEFARLNFPA